MQDKIYTKGKLKLVPDCFSKILENDSQPERDNYIQKVSIKKKEKRRKNGVSKGKWERNINLPQNKYSSWENQKLETGKFVVTERRAEEREEDEEEN